MNLPENLTYVIIERNGDVLVVDDIEKPARYVVAIYNKGAPAYPSLVPSVAMPLGPKATAVVMNGTGHSTRGGFASVLEPLLAKWISVLQSYLDLSGETFTSAFDGRRAGHRGVPIIKVEVTYPKTR